MKCLHVIFADTWKTSVTKGTPQTSQHISSVRSTHIVTLRNLQGCKTIMNIYTFPVDKFRTHCQICTNKISETMPCSIPSIDYVRVWHAVRTAYSIAGTLIQSLPNIGIAAIILRHVITWDESRQIYDPRAQIFVVPSLRTAKKIEKRSCILMMIRNMRYPSPTQVSMG